MAQQNDPGRDTAAHSERDAMEQRMRSELLFEDAPLGIAFVSLDGSYLQMNHTLARIYGYDSPEDMVQATDNAGNHYHDPEDRKRMLALLERMDMVSGFECRMRRKDGSLFWTSRTVRIVRDGPGGESYYVAFVEDIQARKEAELMARTARRRLVDILEQIQAGIFVLEPKTRRILYANEYLTRAMGRELVGQVSNEVLLKNPGPCAFSQAAGAMKELGDTLSQELHFADDRWYLCTAKLSPWLSDEPAVVIVATDITDQKQAEEIKEDMNRIMRHDLKSPLTSILSIPTMLMATGKLNAEEEQLLQIVYDSGRKMLNLIDSSMTLFKIETGKYKLMLQTIDMVKTINDILLEFDILAQGKGLDIRFGLADRPLSPTDSVVAYLDLTLTPFLFSNIIKNAIEAAPEQSVVTITIRSLDPLRIDVHNQGTVPEAIRDTFFDKYVTHGKRKGTGLGTYSARLIARTHGGDVTMTTSEEDGTTLSIQLPCQSCGLEQGDQAHG